MRHKILIVILFLLGLQINGLAQSVGVGKFKDAIDSLSVLARERTGVDVELRLRSVMRKGSRLNFTFTESLGDIPWTESDVKWLRENLGKLLPESESKSVIGDIYSGSLKISDIIVPELHFDGTVHNTAYRVTDHRGKEIVEQVGSQRFDLGLSGRHIALWQSHGRYFNADQNRWKWQRAQDFMTVEDMFTQSFVLPYLIPMLENAGAYVMTPRERDTQKYESVVDNDPSFIAPRSELLRRSGQYRETGTWENAGEGFADAKEIYVHNDNPFTMGTARVAQAKGKDVKATWTPDIPVKGSYAVYVSYKTLPNSTEHAHYTVKHLGGVTEFTVNQKMGGGTWIYLGTFEFAPESGCCVTLDNKAPEGREHVKGSVITADAVRFGGGMGKIARGPENVPDNLWTTSGMPAYMEGALYSMQWAGIDSTIIAKHPDDYTNDFADRGPWVAMLAGGSRMNPDQEGKNIPFDLALAFHTDAGTFPNDSIVGTLSIYTLKSNGSRKFADGSDRMACRELCNYVQGQVVNDIRLKYEPEWTRRQIWDRSYSECRTDEIPAMILETLSHQNFADMKYALDPAFRFDVSRAVYKGILKFLSDRYGCPYAVQPLPVHSFAAIATDGKANLSWAATKDIIEETAEPKGFILYTRIDGGTFDKGQIIKAGYVNGRYSTSVSIRPGHIYSYRIAAYNHGGKSFPSETLSVGLPENNSDQNVLVINNFYRVSAPAWFDTESYAGFDEKLDSGVPDKFDISYIGEMFEYHRDLPWVDDDNAGFGSSYTDQAGVHRAGNTFDYPYVHGKAILASGHGFSSAGSEAFSDRPALGDGFWSADIICGKQVTTTMGRGAVTDRYQVFPTNLQKAISYYTGKGGNIIISGSNIGTDVWSEVYPVKKDSVYTEATKNFVQNVLGYKWLTNYAGRAGGIWTTRSSMINTSNSNARFSYYNEPNEDFYCVETPDGLLPSGKDGDTFLRYTDTNISAAVCAQKGKYKTASFGFPLEVLKEETDIQKLLQVCFDFFNINNTK